MPASIAVFDFRDNPEPIAEPFETPEYETGSRDRSHRKLTPEGKLIGRPISSNEKKQIRRRIRRANQVSREDMMLLYDGKPIDEWDYEELARGRPRAADGSFKGSKPAWIDRAMHEQIVKRFETIVREEMNAHTVEALQVINRVLTDEQIDEKGKPRTSSSTKLDAAKFLVEHIIGKPKQRTETDISVKLQGILGHAIVNPSQDGSYALTSGYVEAPAWEDDDDSEGE